MLAILCLCLPLFSQGNSGRIVGAITDQSGGAMAGAMVTITDVARGTVRTLTTDDSGQYSAPNLIPGSYKVHAEAKGFKATERQNVILEVGGEVRVDLTLQPGEQDQTITVTEQLPLVETTNAELGGTLQNVIINDLPLNGRNFENLLSLRPGVTVYPGGGGWTQSTNGMRAHDNVYLVDGVNSNDPWMAQSIMNAGMASGDAGTILPIDAIDEFKTGENPKAEYGWKPGAIVNVGIKSGTNAIHGTAYAFGRTDSWDARDYFNPAPNPVSPLQFEQFGATVGGPIKKDKLFYFFNYEDQRYSVGNPVTHSNLPITSGAGASGANGLIGACLAALKANGGTGLAPLSAQLAGLSSTCVPLSNYPGLFPANTNSTLNTDINSTNQIDAGLVKGDYHINDKNTLTGTYFISPGNGVLADNTLAQFVPAQLTVQYARAQVSAVNWTWTPNSNWVNEARVGYSHYYQTFHSNDSTQNPANYSFNGSTYHLFTGQTNPQYFGLPVISFSSSHFTMGASWPKTVGPDGVLEVVDHVSVLRGTHAFKFGVEIMRNQSTNNVTSNAKGPIRFADYSSFFEGIPNRANFLSGNLLRHMSNSGFAAFVQDDWRLTPRLTVNAGVRYEIDGVLKERDGLLGNFDPISPTGMVQIGNGESSAYNGDHNNFAPRLGLAWDVAGNGKTVVRMGGGIMYEQFSYDMFNAIGNLLGLRMVPTGVPLYANGKQITNIGSLNVANITFTGSALKGTSTPGQVAFDWINNSSNQPLYSISPACGDGTVTLPGGFTPQPCSIAGVARTLRNPYVTTWTLDVQRALASNLSLDVGYVGNHGTKLIGVQDVNQPPLGAGWTSAAVPGCLASVPDCAPDTDAEQARRPYSGKFPYLQYIDLLSNQDQSNYNGLQVALTQRTSHGLSFTAGYTYSHALDDSSDNWACCIPIYNDRPNLLYGNSVFDITHRFTLSVTYDLPGRKGFAQMLEGWSLNSIVTLQSGLPFGVGDTTNDFSGTAEVNQPADGQEEQWNFYGNPKDFQIQHGFVSNNGDALAGGTGGIPYFPGSGDASAPTSNATCNAKAAALGPLASAALANTGCFALKNSVMVPPAYGTYGQMGKNIFRDGGFRNWDFSVFKNFKFRERLTAQFRAEFFNVLNHPEFSNPGGPGGGAGTTDPSVGAGFGCGCVTPDTGASNPVLGSGGPRAMQLGLKLIF